MSHDHACPYCTRVFKWGKDEDSHFGIAAAGRDCGDNAHWKLTGHISAYHPYEGFLCGRRGEGVYGASAKHLDHWNIRNGYRACSYCGSMHPDDLFSAIEAGTCQISGTDKNYKIYVDVPHPGAGQACIVSSANHKFSDKAVLLTDALCDEHGLDSYVRAEYVGDWVEITPRGPRTQLKFYYQHFDAAQQQRFIELYNQKKLPLEPRFGLYRKPYFAIAE